MLTTTVFQAFSNAIERGVWQIGQMAYSTITGNTLSELTDIDAIVDEGDSSEQNASPSAATISSDLLLYVRPSQMPTTDTAELTASFAVQNTQTGKTYSIVDAGIGKNQETGAIEHIELKLRQTGVA